MRTELRIEGANCPHCLNETVNRLRLLDGVHFVDNSFSSECLIIEHDHLDPETFVHLLRDSVHGVGMSGNEVVMSPVEPAITVLHCDHDARIGTPAKQETMVNPQLTLGALVTTRPALAANFDRLGLDYCCGGGRTLAEAVDTAGLDLDEVLDALGTEPHAPIVGEWAQFDLIELVDHIEATHHAYLDKVLPRLDALATKVNDVHGQRHPELAAVHRLVRALDADMEPHLRQEEQVLFPMIRDLAAATSIPASRSGSLLSILKREHDRVGELLAALRLAAGEFKVPDDSCESYRSLYAGLAELEADTHLHVHKENNLLFPAVIEAEQTLLYAAP